MKREDSEKLGKPSVVLLTIKVLKIGTPKVIIYTFKKINANSSGFNSVMHLKDSAGI